jgi:hypothetical protein
VSGHELKNFTQHTEITEMEYDLKKSMISAAPVDCCH